MYEDEISYLHKKLVSLSSGKVFCEIAFDYKNLWNYGSIKSYIKKVISVELLRANRINILSLQKT